MSDAPERKPSNAESLSTDANLAEIVQAFVADLPSRLAELSAACDAGRLEEIGVLAQRLKTAPASTGYPDLCDRAAALERLASGGSQDEMNAVIREINELVEAIQAGLNTER